MFGHIIGGRSSNTVNGSRYFRYEVTGLHHNEVTELQDHSIRSSASVLITVPFTRLNETTQRITRLGGKIVNIQPLALSSPVVSDSTGN